MGLFDIFKDTVFLKEGSDLEKQLNDLKSIKDIIEKKDEIEKDIKRLEYGIAGEKQVAHELKNANIGMYVLHDVTFEYEGNKAQIDYLLFTKGYFYIIECKNLYGNITIDNDGQFYRENNYKGKIIREAIYSPYTQAVKHQDMMKKVWSTNHSKLVNFLAQGFQRENFFKPLVVLSNSNSILNKENAPKEIKNNVIRADQLINYIQKDINSMIPTELSNEKFLKKAAEIWLSRSITNDTNIADKYLNNMKETNNKEYLENKLRTFRKEKAKSMKVPAYYIFTDKEMNNLITLKPKTIEELKESKILKDIKVKCHGEEIVNILNNN